MDLDDLFSEATIGLIQATDAFDSARGVRFATCAQYWIKAALNRYVHRNRSIVKPPTGSKPLQDVSLNETLDGEDRFADTRQDQLVDDGPDPEASCADADFHEGTIRVARSVLENRDYRIFEARYLADVPWTREELSRDLGVSRERIRQIETRARAKVQRAARSFTKGRAQQSSTIPVSRRAA
jgi:RNA polymerase sigma-32 factor